MTLMSHASASRPDEYQDFQNVFDKRSISELPSDKPWDHKIPLRSGAEPPYKPIYSMSAGELKALWQYLKENPEGLHSTIRLGRELVN